MGGYFDDWNSGNTDDEYGDEFQPTDPLENLGKREQDIFFRVLDLIPDDKRELAMEYFYDHPQKINGLIEYVKQHKAQLTKQDPALAPAALASQGVAVDDLGETPASFAVNEDEDVSDENSEDKLNF